MHRLLPFLLLLVAMMVRADKLPLSFQSLTPREGLSQFSVTTMLQDRDGFMWFGTQYGLNRYDGYRFHVFKHDPDNVNTLSDHWITALAEDGDGYLWIGTHTGGLNRYNRYTDSFHSYGANEGLDNLIINCVFIDSEGRLWAGTRGGLYRYDAKLDRFARITRGADNSSDEQTYEVLSLNQTSKDSLWVGTMNGLFLFDLATGVMADNTPGTESLPVDVRINALLHDSLNRLWIGSNRGLYVRIAQTEPTNAISLVAVYPNEDVLALMEDRVHTIWVGTYQERLLRFESDKLTIAGIYQHDELDSSTFGSGRIVSLLQDRSGSLWVGTWTGGVGRADLLSGGFGHWSTRQSEYFNLADSRAQVLSGDGHQYLYVGGPGGIHQINIETGKVRRFQHSNDNPSSLVNNGILDLSLTPDGQLWVQTRAGCGLLDPHTGFFKESMELRTLCRDNNFRSGSVFISDDESWIGFSDHGLVHRQHGNITHFVHQPGVDNSLISDRVACLFYDKDGQLWIATDDGLDRFDPRTNIFAHFISVQSDVDTLPHNRVNSLYVDGGGRMWIATAGGLALVQNENGKIHFKRYTHKDGLFPEALGAVLEDAQGNLWISTIDGILRFDLAKQHFQYFGLRDGALVGGYYVNSSNTDDQGHLYFGGARGLTVFSPTDIRENPIAPQITLTEMRLFNSPVDVAKTNSPLQHAIFATRSILLYPEQSVFSFEFSAMHYSDTERNRYQYSLQGFDTKWIDTDASNARATYTNLEPGDYMFNVKAANKDGLWSQDGVHLQIHVLPPYWKTWWFRLLLLLTTLLSIWTWMRWRTRRLHRQRELLQEQVRQRTDELEQAYGNIATLAELGKQITASLDVHGITDTLYHQINAVMDAAVFGVGVYDSNNDSLEFPRSVQDGVALLPYRRSLQEKNQLAVWCFDHRHSLILNDLEKEICRYIQDNSLGSPATRADGKPDKEHHSALYAPLLVGERCLGVVAVLSEQYNAYENKHLDMLQTLASYTAIALDNAQAHHRLIATQQQLALQEKMAGLGTLTAGVAHEINNPTNFAHVAAQNLRIDLNAFEKFLSDLVQADDAPEIVEAFAQRFSALFLHADTILNGTSRIKNIVRDLRSFTRADEAEQKVVILSECLMSTLNLVRSSYQQTVKFDVDLAYDPQVECWPAQLNQVFMNIIVNACQAIVTHHKQRPGVQGQLQIRSHAIPDHVVIEFADQGGGIQESCREKIFEPFFTTKDVGEGTGLGLHLSYKIIAKHHGTLTFSSQSGIGSTFVISLPLRQLHPREKEDLDETTL